MALNVKIKNICIMINIVKTVCLLFPKPVTL